MTYRWFYLSYVRDHRGRDRMVVKVVSSNPVNGEMYSIEHLVKFVSDLRQVCGFLWVLWFPPEIKLTAMI